MNTDKLMMLFLLLYCVIVTDALAMETSQHIVNTTKDSVAVKIEQIITFGAAPSVVFGSTGTLSAQGGASGNPVVFSSKTVSTCVISGTTVTGIAAGLCTVAANQAGNTNYKPANQVLQTFNVSKANQVISFGTAPSINVGSSGQIKATGGGSLKPIVLTSNTPNVCTVSSNIVKGVLPGTCSIAANQKGNINYNAASTAIQSFTIGVKAPSFAYISNSKYMYSTASFVNTITVIDLATNAQVAVIPVVVYGGIVANSTGTRIYALGDNTVSIIDTTTNKVVGTMTVATPTISKKGIAISSDDSRLYIGSYSNTNGNVTVIDIASGGIIQTITVGKTPQALAINPVSHFIYTANFSDGTVSVIDPVSLLVTATVAVGQQPVNITATEQKIYVALRTGAGATAVIDATTNKLITILPVGGDNVAVSSVDNRIYVTSWLNKVSIIDPVDDSIIATVPAPTSFNSIAKPVGNFLYLLDNASDGLSISDSLSILDIATTNLVFRKKMINIGAMAIVKMTSLPAAQAIYVPPLLNRGVNEIFTLKGKTSSGFPITYSTTTPQQCTVNGDIVTAKAIGVCSITASQNGDGVYYAPARSVTRHFNVATMPVAQTAGFSFNGQYYGNTLFISDVTGQELIDLVIIGRRPIGIAVNPDKTKVYITNAYSYSVSVLDWSTRKVLATIPVGSYPQGIVVNKTRAYVANSESDTVSVIDTSTYKVINTIPAGDYPVGITINPTGSRVYTTNHFLHQISVIDTTKNLVIANISTGGGYPVNMVMNADGSRLFVGNRQPGSVSVIDTAINKTIGNIPVGSYLSDLVLSQDGQRLYVYMGYPNPSSVSVIDTATYKIIETELDYNEFIDMQTNDANSSNGIYSYFGQMLCPCEQNISFHDVTNKRYGSKTYLYATSSSGLPVAFSSLTPSICTISDKTVSLVATGFCTIKAMQIGNAAYLAAPRVLQSFRVN